MKRIVACMVSREEFKQFITDVLGGRTYSLGRHFWAFLWLPTVIINIFILAHRATYFAMNAEVADMLGDLLWAIQFAVFFVGYVGLVNCVRRQRRWGWGIPALILPTLSAIVVVAKLLGAPTPTNQISQEVRALDAGLPQKLDDIRMLTKVDYDSVREVVTFFYDINMKSNDISMDAWAQEKSDIKFNACQQLKGAYALLRKMRFVFNFAGRIDAIDVVHVDCK